MDLVKTKVLFLDCQTTGANPGKGAVIEIGWARSDFSRDNDAVTVPADSYLLKLPAGQELPARVQAITGIAPSDLDSGHEPGEIWARLVAIAGEIAHANRLDKCPLVIHFAKFETPFLIHFHDKYSDGNVFPFRIICTHMIARRLFPELPRRSLRAMAGYFGHTLEPTRRCTEHVMATALVWHEMTRVLTGQRRITTLEQLLQWLDQPVLEVPRERAYPMQRSARLDLPDRPGVYRMLRANGDVLYVGKAGSLKDRVNSYFRRSSRHPEHILEMLSQARQLDVTATDTALEAALLESDEIKHLSPPYNRALRKGERVVWFCSKDLDEFSTNPNNRCRIGPLSNRNAIERFGAIKKLLQEGDLIHANGVLLRAALGIPEGYAPDDQCIRAGFEMFLKQHSIMLHKWPRDRALIELGQRIWQERQVEREMDTEESEAFELESAKISIWTPGSVCHLIESNLARGTHEIRGARWFVLLSESSIAWEESAGNHPDRYLIVFEKGQVLYLRPITGGEIPVPPGHRTTFKQRQYSFDLVTLDRMRVITAEIRKMLVSKNWIRLRLSPNSVLERDDLSRVFRWI